MAIPGTTSALIAAFVFGIVVNAASAGLFLNVKGHGSSIFRDGKRLVLVLFLLSAALWAQVDFITTLIDPTATASCQVGVIFTTLFDQLARFSIEQHLLWVISNGMKPGPLQYILQVLLAIRLVLGGVFVGLSKPEFNTVCVPLSSVLIVAIITVIVDAVIIVGLAGQAMSAGVFGKMQDGGQASNRGKAVIAVLAGLVIWTGTSVPMSLGVLGSDYLTRSTIPGGGLAALIIIVIAFSDSLVAPDSKRDQERRLPEAPSPRMITTARSLSTSNSNDYPPSRFEDLKTEQLSSLTAFVQPREVPQPGQPVVLTKRFSQNLPTIANASSEQGVGGLPVQGALFPPMRANTEPHKPTAPRQIPQEPTKRAFFDSGKGPAKSVAVGGKLAISNPVLQQGGSNPLDKMATTDLATAAQMDKDRRAMMAFYNESNTPAELSANPLSANPERGLMQNTSTIRKEVAAAVSEPLRPDSETLSTGSATGAQLSPSGDELRRRSPRQTSPKSSVELQAAPETPPVPSKSPGRFVPKPLTAPGPNPVIRPSRQRPASPESVAEPLKTPLQRRPTAGLPMNPRSRSIRRPSPPESGKSRQETVLFVNDIVYNDPNFVASVLEDANDRRSKAILPSVIMPDVETLQDQALLVPQVKALPEPPNTASSVVHRPRPIPRKPSEEDSDAFYPPTGHKKSRSLGNLMQRKPILQSNPGSPTTLPPLPPPPMSARNERPHPNDTKSMTYSEKVNFLFPALQAPERSNRRSSVPDVPTSSVDDSATLTDNEAREMRDRYSKRTTTSARTRSIFDEQDQSTQREVSMGTYRGLVNEADAEQQQDSPGERGSRPNGAKRASSPVLPIFGDLRSASTADYEDDATNIGSIYSPRHVQQVGLAVHQARAIEVTRLDRASPDNRGVSAVTSGEEMTIMLDTSVARDIQQAQDGSNSPVDDGSPVEETTSTRSSGPWHRRVGETTLSFSGHSDKRGSKRGPPPTPLALSDRPTQAKQVAIAQAAEPSPLPSPEEALQLIQAQLKKYEQLDRASVESPGRQALLNDLEAEMGQQESRWLGMQNRFTQDSMTTLDMSPTAESRRTSAAIADVSSEQSLSRNSSTRSNMAAERSAYRRTRQASIASSVISFTNDGDAPFGSRASLWQKRLAAAHQEFIHTASELDRTRSRNFLALSSNLGSPTPPDSDESETEIESRRNLAAVLARRAKEEEAKNQAIANSLWTKVQPQKEQIGLMWVRPEKPYHVPVVEPPLPGLSVRPAQRKESSELSIESSQLWQKAVTDKPSSSSKLWVSSVEVEEPEEMSTPASAPAPEVRNFYNPGIRRSQTVSGRPLTQRPPRRSKRITALPDIIEDPVPLPDKRDTLGIFQFPWGEKSDVPSVQQRPAFTAMPGTMATGGVRGTLESRSREIEQAEYSSSFFDEYEEDDDSDSMGSESDDGFDETTLFEIASLLKANNVPSTDSFFGNVRDSRDSGDSLVDQYMSEEQRDIEHHSRAQQTLAALEEEMEGLQMMPSPLPPLQLQSLWEDDLEDDEEERGSHGKGLPQPDDWHRYDEMSETIRAKPRLSQQPASVESDTLWVQQPRKSSTSNSPMWTPPDSPTKPSSSETASQEDSLSRSEFSGLSSTEIEASPEASGSSSPLWKVQEQPQRGQHGVGLPQPENFSEYNSVQLTARAKPRQAEPAVIESVDLWTAPEPENVSVPTKTWTPKPTSAPVTRSTSPARHAARQVKEVSKMLWSPPASPKQIFDDGLFSAKSGRTDFRNTAQEPAAVGMDRKTQSPARQALDRLTSTALWASPARVQAPRNWLSANAGPSSPKRLLWSAPASPNKAVTSGLFDPKIIRSDYRITSQAPAALEGSRKARSPEMKSLDRLMSTTLWAAIPQIKSEKNWISLKASSTPKRMLWSAPASPKEIAEFGLFTRSGRTEFRTTSRAPAAVVMNRKPRSPEVKPLERLTSKALWKSAVPVENETNWLFIKSSPQRQLWSAPASPKDVAGSGLFTKSARTDFKTTSMAPAAIAIDRKPRPLEEKTLEKLSSTSLWIADDKSATQRDWISSANASGTSTPNTLRIASTPEMWRKALEEAVAASYPVAAINTSSSAPRVTPVAPEQWLQALDQAIAASYPIHQPAARRATIQASPSDWSAALTEAIAKSYSITVTFDASRRHPVFAASSLVSKASIIHPAAIGYTADVAAVHPVFFGSGAGKPVHPAVPSKTVIEPFSTASPVPEEVEQVATQSSTVAKGKGRRITAMASMFEDASQKAPVSRSFSISRQSSMSSLRRTVTPPRAATPEPEPAPEPHVEEAQEIVPAQQYEMNPALLAQIEALEQERLFAEQWAAGSFQPAEHVPEPADGPLEPSPMIFSATAETASTSNQISKADQLAEEMFTPTSESPAPILLEAKTYESPSTPVKQQALSAEELGEQMFTPVDVTPRTQLASLSVPSSSEPKTPSTPTAQPTTPKSSGWFSSISARLGGKSPRSPPRAEQPSVPQVPQLQRSNTVTSTVSAMSESDTITLRDSLISVDSERGKQVAGSKIQIRY
ncbi:hypothetical protein N0V93_002538 [Gnomoniopsis smithogilvyi]|uniref:Uncharacterized protein n=1 Tax=Gnomoniopsis smithogilvyi TaxID=1191159 RepID=A0A9W8YUZ3_9PEZI|nr:hypothetical protein N0V93_002538 [Gnomoniopsis smithogilvyi]